MSNFLSEKSIKAETVDVDGSSSVSRKGCCHVRMLIEVGILRGYGLL